MKPIDFKEKNLVIAKDQPEYIPVPALAKRNAEGEIVFCWGIPLKERIILLFTGRLWVSLWRFRDEKGRPNPMQPIRGSVYKREMIVPCEFEIGDFVESNGCHEQTENDLNGLSFQVVDITQGTKDHGAAVWIMVGNEKRGYFEKGLKKTRSSL